MFQVRWELRTLTFSDMEVTGVLDKSHFNGVVGENTHRNGNGSQREQDERDF